MKASLPVLHWIFAAVELAVQLLISPVVLITVVALLAITKLIGRQVRKGSWRSDASWQGPAPGVRSGT